MKFMLIALVTFSAHAALIVDCKDAGGFYGNIEVRKVGSTIKIAAQQSFADQLSPQLNLTSEIFRYDIGIKESECELKDQSLVCEAGVGSILATAYGQNGRNVTIPFSGIVQLSVLGDEVELVISLDHRIARANHSFRRFEQEGCRFEDKR